MNSLRVRIAAILLASITFVVCLATVAAILVGRHNGGNNYGKSVAGQIRYLGHLALAHSGQVATPDPPGGEQRDDLAAGLKEALRQSGEGWAVRVVQPVERERPFASVQLAPSSWITLPMPDVGPPPDALIVLSGWMLLILTGTAAVSLVIARRVTRPLLLLEGLATRIGATGELEHIPEDGPAEVRATARALNRLSHNLRHALESRMRLVAAAGHDLRTPLTRMRLRAEFLDEAERSKWLHNINELERIAESAIALVKEQTGSYGRETIRLDVMARSVVDDVRTLNVDATVHGTMPVCFRGPPLAMTRALRNLVINAATHGGGAHLWVESRDGRAILTIEDEGPGIPEDLMGRIFEPFFRSDQARRQPVPGAGLGLAIAREIIQRAGGDLTLSNSPTGGLRQVVAFPITPAVLRGGEVAPGSGDGGVA